MADLKHLIQDLINGKTEQAEITAHEYMLSKVKNLIEAKKSPKIFVLISINIDYFDDYGRDKNKDHILAVKCASEEAAMKLNDELHEMGPFQLDDEKSRIDVDDIVNGSTNSHTWAVTLPKVSATAPKSAYVVDEEDVKFQPE
jgi:tRNA U34 5-carboxymethylaminomethyl modifying GTPase MnmE/TrmE